MKLLLSYLKRYRLVLALALFLAAVNQIFSLLDPWIFQHILDGYVTKIGQFTSTQFFRGVGVLLLLAVGAALVSRIAKNFQDYYTNVVIQRLGAQVYADGLEHSIKLPYSVFEDQSSGETLGRLQKLRLDIQNLIQAFVGTIFTSSIGFVFVSIYAARINLWIAGAYLVTMPIIAGVSLALSTKIKKVQRTIVAQTTALAGSTTESLRNVELVKSLGLAGQEIARLNSTTNAILKLELQKVKYVRSLSFVQGTVVNAMRMCILFLLLYMVFAGKVTFGEFFSLYIYSFAVFNPLQDVGTIISTYRESEVSLNNFEKILAMPVEAQPEHPVDVGTVHDVEFSGVTFRHQSASTNALTGVSFKVSAGETIAFVGPSGSGKTTTVKLLVGLYSPVSGTVLYNGTPGTQVDMNPLRQQFGIVTQDTQLFAGTIRDNLLFVNPNATDAECLDVLRKAAAGDLLARADKGLDTLIGEGGVKVSGGEKQRLSIARALLRHPNILVFDEATSSLDSLTEEEISKTIREVSSGAAASPGAAGGSAPGRKQITVMIAHRLSTVMHADRIYVLEKGVIVEHGSHAELLAAKGLYSAMWRQQVGERE